MGRSSDNEPTARFNDDDLARVWQGIDAGRLIDDDDDFEDEGATEIVQQLDLEDLQLLEGDSGLFSLEEPSSEHAMVPGRLMPHTPRGAAHRMPHDGLGGVSMALLARVMGLGALVGASAVVSVWWFLG